MVWTLHQALANYKYGPKCQNCCFAVHLIFYVTLRFYPLGQDDLPNEFKFRASVLQKGGEMSQEHPQVVPGLQIADIVSQLATLVDF